MITNQRTKATLSAILHLVNGFHAAVSCAEELEETSYTYIEEMQKAINDEWERLQDGRMTSLQENHSHTYPEPGEAPFCGNKPECNNAEGCDDCKEFGQWLDEIIK